MGSKKQSLFERCLRALLWAFVTVNMGALAMLMLGHNTELFTAIIRYTLIIGSVPALWAGWYISLRPTQFKK